MKVTGYICCALAFACLMNLTNTATTQNRIDQQLLESLESDGPIKNKRPFCNAFTGCGRKRSFPENALNLQKEEQKNVRLLQVPLYRALLRAASEEMQKINDRESIGDHRRPQLSQDDFSIYPEQKVPLDERFDS